MRNPNQHLPNVELRAAIFQRLDGNIQRLDTSTLPIYDEVPEDFRDYDFVEIDAATVTPLDERHGHYDCEVVINIYSTYAGYKEVSSEAEQINRYLASALRSMTNFTDSSEGGMLVSYVEAKKSSEEGTIVRHGELRRKWTIADNRR